MPSFDLPIEDDGNLPAPVIAQVLPAALLGETATELAMGLAERLRAHGARAVLKAAWRSLALRQEVGALGPGDLGELGKAELVVVHLGGEGALLVGEPSLFGSLEAAMEASRRLVFVLHDSPSADLLDEWGGGELAARSDALCRAVPDELRLSWIKAWPPSTSRWSGSSERGVGGAPPKAPRRLVIAGPLLPHRHVERWLWALDVLATYAEPEAVLALRGPVPRGPLRRYADAVLGQADALGLRLQLMPAVSRRLTEAPYSTAAIFGAGGDLAISDPATQSAVAAGAPLVVIAEGEPPEFPRGVVVLNLDDPPEVVAEAIRHVGPRPPQRSRPPWSATLDVWAQSCLEILEVA